MDAPVVDACIAGGMGVACQSPLVQWPSPPAAHTHHNSQSAINSNSSTILNNSTYTGFPSSVSDNENSDSIMSDCNARGGTSPSMGTNSNNHSSNVNGQKQNHVGTIMLHGVAIVSLVIDHKERLCLAQISNTLLKDYSYNEIHNRRVALGITCVQCTPVQLEILRRAGAMPVSSRRCGMITKREAERLVKSFLEENTPPKLPEDFAFDVHHECGWGCRGWFEPSRYNSSRAKCIKCTYCNMYFSPNKFIFHFHRTPESKYNHPDAANFNSWRRHLKLCSGIDKDEIIYKWEDVKAMFNGGTRKRVFTSSSPSSSTTASSITSSSMSSSNHATGNFSMRHQSHSDGSSSAKKAKQTPVLDTNPYLPKPPAFPNPFNPYSWLTAAPGKTPYPFMTMNSSQSMCFGFPQQSAPNKDVMVERMKASPMAPTAWMGRAAAPTGAPFPLSSMDLFWDKAFAFPQAAALGFRNTGYPSSAIPSNHSATAIMDNGEHLSPPGDVSNPCLSPPHNVPQNLIKSNYERGEKVRDRMSAFKRVVPSSLSPSSSVSPPPSTNGDNDGNGNDECHQEDDDGDDENMCAEDLSTHNKDIDDSEEIDVEEDSDEKKKKNIEEGEITRLQYKGNKNEEENAEEQRQSPIQAEQLGKVICDDKVENEDVSNEVEQNQGQLRSESRNSADNVEDNANDSHEPATQDSGLSDESDTEAENHRAFVEMTKEQLCQTLKCEVESRRRREKEVTVLKETFRDEVNREKSFREHMAQQLEFLRETLTSELEQERKIRFSLQQKLKEAHDALQNFSCGLLAGRRDMFPLKDTEVLPR